jgi:O-antigen/teichoic acid export membrane protein
LLHPASTLGGVLVNTGFRLLTRAITVISGAIVGALIGRIWGVEALGLYASVTALVGLVSFAFELGLPGLLRRRIAYDPPQARDLFSTSFTVLPVGWAVGTGLSVVGALLLLRDQAGSIPVVIAACLWAIAGAANWALAAYFLATGRMGYETRVTLIERVTLVPLVALVVSATTSLVALFVAMALARLIAVGIYLRTICALAGRPTLTLRPQRMWEIMRSGVPFWVHNLFTYLYMSQSVLILTALSTSYDVGLYRSASLFTLQFPLVAVSLNDAIFPGLMQRWAAGDRSGLLRGVRSSVLLTTALGALAGLGLIVVADQLVTAFYGEAFRPAAQVLAILALGLPFAFANNSIGMYLTIIDRQQDRAAISVIGAAIGGGLNLLLIPRDGYLGAAIATSLTEAAVVVALLAMCWRAMRAHGGLQTAAHPVRESP